MITPMEFGKLADIQNINWTLPEDDSKNASHIHLAGETPSALFFGAPAWGSKHWLGKIYPKKTPTQEFLHYYSRNFTCIELNTTHYRIPDEKTTHEWLSKVPEHFLFCPKLPKDISHARNGLVDKITLEHWLDFLQRMKTNLGPCFIQLSEYFSYQDKMLLFKFLESWPSEFKLTLELRHPSWFQDGVILPALTDYLNRKNIGLVITDVAGRRDVLHSSLSTNWSLIRLIGNNLDPSDELRLSMWAERIKNWQSMGLPETYLFLHQPDDVMTIEFASKALEVFHKAGFSNLPHLQMQTQADLLSIL
ncbi:DUF72 domain-containing protein [Bacteriovorax sp. PP10]|uniref:DUF72 domain-containing protein n=1 Tax=Bacteriovorax antarcticus TaxID=3088717 RepID=A0ABU5VSP7_9BACT|nr:DUF72 domain-containing protein [Bacteriovorax sp. PP10]MEA9356081.1 DUF72 domain-containing protein [Bacteriovorax sp. PP10]